MSEKELHSFERRWARAKELWYESCGGVDEVLSEYTTRFGGRVESWRNDSPSRVLYWRDESAEYTISMALEEEGKLVLQIWPAAWHDDEKELTRRFLLLEPVVLETPVLINLFNQTIATATQELQASGSALQTSGVLGELHQGKIVGKTGEVPLDPRLSPFRSVSQRTT